MVNSPLIRPAISLGETWPGSFRSPRGPLLRHPTLLPKAQRGGHAETSFVQLSVGPDPEAVVRYPQELPIFFVGKKTHSQSTATFSIR